MIGKVRVVGVMDVVQDLLSFDPNAVEFVPKLQQIHNDFLFLALAGRKLMNDVIADGKTWPFIEEFPDLTSYRGYFLSHAAFVVREVSTGRVLGAFYVKVPFTF